MIGNATPIQPIPTGSTQHSIMQPQTAVSGGTWREQGVAGAQPLTSQSSPPSTPHMMSRRVAHWATSPVQGVAGGVAWWAVSAPLRGTLPFARARALARAPLNTTSATNAHHHAGSVASHNTWLQAWHHRRHQPHRPLPLTTLARAFDHCLPPPHLADPKPCALPVPELLPCLGIGLRLCCCTHVACLNRHARALVRCAR